MDISQLSHLPKLKSRGEETYFVFENALISGMSNIGPYNISVVGIYKREGDSRGLPNCEEYIPDSGERLLVFSKESFEPGQEISASKINYCHPESIYSYDSDKVSIRSKIRINKRLFRTFKNLTRFLN